MRVIVEEESLDRTINVWIHPNICPPNSFLHHPNMSTEHLYSYTISIQRHCALNAIPVKHSPFLDCIFCLWKGYLKTVQNGNILKFAWISRSKLCLVLFSKQILHMFSQLLIIHSFIPSNILMGLRLTWEKCVCSVWTTLPTLHRPWEIHSAGLDKYNWPYLRNTV